MYKQHAAKYLLLFTFIMALLMPFYSSCTRKEQPEPVIPANTGSNEQKKPDTKPEYQRPLEETILLSASEDKVEVNGIDEAAEGVTVLFAEPYTFADTAYETVTVENDYVKKVNVSTTAVEMVFQDDVTARLEYQKEVSLDIDTELSFIGYMSEPVEVPFKVTKLGHGDISFNVGEATEGFKPEVEYDEESHTGIIRFSLSSLPGTREVAYIFVTDGGENSTTYTITAKTYHFDITVEDITLGGEEGATAPLSFKVDTDIPDYVLEYETEGDFFTFADGVVTTTSENRTEVPKTGQISIFESKRVFSPIEVKITQESLPAVPSREDCIVFNDMNFKNAMKAFCDTDHDGEVSFDEALTVKEVIANGAGIKDLKGLEYFKNAWKVNLQDNDIVDATVLKELPLLYWLDLKGNKNLKTFDVTGCTQYFEHCEYEVSPELVYYAYRYQYGVAGKCDPFFEHSPEVADTRVTTDWSHHKKMTLVHQHTKTINTEEMPWIFASQKEMVPSIVFTGLSYIDVDFNNGTWERLFKQTYEQFCQKTIIGEYIEYFDIYFLEYMVDSREKFYFEPNSYRDSDECENALKLLEEERDKLFLFAYDSLYGNTEWAITSGSKPSKQYPAQLLIKIDSQPLKETIVLNNRCCFNCAGFYTQDKYTANGREMQYKTIFSTNFRSINQAITTADIKELSIEELIGIPASDYYESFLRFARILN